MKKILMFTLVMIFLFSALTMAHSPQNVNAKFNLDDNMLTVAVTHNVGGSNSSHYVEEIIVTYNEEEIVMQKPGQQLNNKEMYYYYMPGLEEGDQIQINTICSIQGNSKVTFTVNPASK